MWYNNTIMKEFITADTETLKQFKDITKYDYNQDVINYQTSANYDGRRIWLISFSDDNLVYDVYNHQEKIITLLLKRKIIYFHNLSYDGCFIIKLLQKMGYKEKNQLSEWHSTNWYEVMMVGSKIYRIQIQINHKQVTLLDSSNFIREKVKDIPKKYGIPNIEKGWKGKGYDEQWMYDHVLFNKTNGELLSEFMDYCKTDCVIVNKALMILIDFLKKNDIKQELTDYITVSSLAYDVYKDMNKDIIKYLSIDTYDYRPIYKGGFCDANSDYTMKPLKNVSSYDINSAYPAILKNKMLPCSFEKQEGLEYVTSLYKICLTKDCYAKTNLRFLFNDSHVMKIGDKSHPEGFEEYSVFYLFKEELDYATKYYDLEYDIIENKPLYGCYFDKGGYVDKFYSLKKQFKGGNKGFETLAKLFMNSVTGKFGQRMEYQNRVIFTNQEQLTIYKKKMVNKKVKKIKQDIKTNPSQDHTYYEAKRYVNDDDVSIEGINNYLLVSYITAMTRCLIIKISDRVGVNRWCYSDTDSVKLFGTLDDKDIIGFELGQFKYEGTANEAWFYHPKAYCWDGEFTFAGVSKDKTIGINPKDINIGYCITSGKKARIPVKDGLELEDVDYVVGE